MNFPPFVEGMMQGIMGQQMPQEDTQKNQMMPNVGGMQPGPGQQQQGQMVQAPNPNVNGQNDPMMLQDKQMMDMFKGIFGGGMFGG